MQAGLCPTIWGVQWLSVAVMGSSGIIPCLCWLAHGTAGNRLCPGEEQAEPGPLCLVSSSWQSWIPTWWSLGCWRWGTVGCKGEPNCMGLPGRRRRWCHPLGQKARSHQAFEVAAFENKGGGSRGWGGKMAGKCQGSRQRWQRVSSWQRRSLFQNDWDHLVYVNTFYFTVWEECK